MYFTSSLVAWLLFEFESELSLSHHPSTRFETTFRISDHLAEKTTFFELKNSSLLLAFKYSPYEIVHNRTCVFERSVVLADGNIKGSGCKPETDEMTDVDVKARFQTGTTGNSSNQILEISDSDIARGVFYVFVLINNRGAIF